MSDTPRPSAAAAAEAASDAAARFGATPAAVRAQLLDEIATRLAADRHALVALAVQETNLPLPRLDSEIDRTTYQLRAFSRMILAGRHMRAVIEHADPEYPLGAAPDLRSMLHPIGPVAVFAASNFPFAFSVAGGDTASALAAGCPVVVKAHPGHPLLSRATADIITGAVFDLGHHPGVFSLIEGEQEGADLVAHPRIRAASFTGSTGGGRALFDIASRRSSPIPFYGELGSINPVFITREALDSRGDEIVAGFVGSVSLGVGQFCTKPGLVFVPAAAEFAERAATLIDAVTPARMLSERIRSGFIDRGSLFTEVDGVDVIREGDAVDDAVGPALFRTHVSTFLAHGDRLIEERFGPSALIVEYDDLTQLHRAAETVEGTLTWTLHADTPVDAGLSSLVDEARSRSGRLVYNGWPTGVTVSPAMMHGGPYPATTSSLHTSVGTAAIGRFLRPVSYQDFPDELLPAELAESNPLEVPRETDLSRARG